MFEFTRFIEPISQLELNNAVNIDFIAEFDYSSSKPFVNEGIYKEIISMYEYDI